jgi:osmotically inducible protein OsmC
MKRRANSTWKGSGQEGSGSLTTQSKAFDNQPYSTKMRFESEDGKLGTNPEELIAAAHAGCFNMALSFQLGGNGYTPDELNTDAVVTIEQVEGSQDFEINHIQLKLKGKVPGISKEEFEKLANNAKQGCPISKALSIVKIDLDIELS